MKATDEIAAPALLNTSARAVAVAGSIVLLALATILGVLIAPLWGVAPVALLYLAPVLTAAIFAGFWPALLTAVASTMAYNYYFTQPYHSFSIHSPADLVTVVMLLVVGAVTSRLAGSLRDQARLATDHASRNSTIAGFARQLLSCPPEEAAIAAIASRELHRLFECHVVVLRGVDRQMLLAKSPDSGGDLSPGDLSAAAHTLVTGESTGRGTARAKLVDWQFHAVTGPAGIVAAVGLARGDGGPPVSSSQHELLSSLNDQIALALERARLEGEARDIAALRERDRLRAVLLAGIGDEVRPRLTAIANAGRALRRGGGDKALATTIASEATRLDNYIDELVGLEPGADQAPLAIGEISVDLHKRTVTRGGTAIHLTPKEFAVLAELARNAGRVLSHEHLLRSVWGAARIDNIDYLRVAIRSLRVKLEADPGIPTLILNEPAVGYRLATD